MMIEVIVIFGEEAAKRYDEIGKVPSRWWFDHHDGIICKKQFNTKEEYRAYLQGLEDMNGNQGFSITEPQEVAIDCERCQVWRFYFADRENDTYCPDCGQLIKIKKE